MHSLWLGLLFLHRLGVMNLMMHVALDEHEPLKVRISQGGSHLLSLHPEFTRTQPTACQSEPAKKKC